MSNITPAGYIVTDNELIYGTGQTADAAWSDAMDTLRKAGITVLGDGDDTTDQSGSWMREADLRIRSASAVLIQDVQDKGGAIGWEMVGGVACTLSEHCQS